MIPVKYYGCYKIAHLILAIFLILFLAKDTHANAPGIEGWPDHDDRFFVFEACHMKYGFIPTDPHDKPPPPTPPGKVPHNVAQEECARTFFRQKFCRNQLRELKNEPYQRICKDFNEHHLKFYAMVFGAIGMGAFLRTVMKALKTSLPYTVLLMIIGMGLGGLSNISSFCVDWTPFTNVARTPPAVLLNIFLPVLIFESSFNMKAHLFFKSIFSILILALPGMLITTFVTAGLCQLFFFSYEWTFMQACLFGCIISATDPVAVVSILKEVGTSETLSILVDGESLLNDGVAILLYEVFAEIIDEENFQLKSEHGHDKGLKIFIMFVRITLGGPVFGWLTAKLTIWFLSKIFNDAAVEVSATLCAAYLTYFIGEAYLGVSGVMALVLLGITLSSERTCISPEVHGLVHHFWEMLGYLANTVLFVLVGIVITETAVASFKPEDGYYMIFLYFALNIVRFLMIGLMSPLLSRIGYGLSWQNMVIMTWGGLRGAVGICLALQVFKDKIICHMDNIGPKILLQTAGIVLLTLVINGTTTKHLLDMLKLTELSIGKIQDMANAVRQIRSAQQKSLRILRHDRFLADANWSIVEEYTEILDPYVQRNIKAKEALEAKKTPSLVADIGGEPVAMCPDCDIKMETEPGGEEMRELTEEARLRLLKALKVSCWRQYEQGVLTEEAVLILQDVWEKLEDKKYEMLNSNDFNNYWEVTGFFARTRRWLSKYIDNTGNMSENDYPEPEKPWRKTFHKMTKSVWFSIFIYLVIIANILITVWEASFIADEDYRFTKKQYIMFYLINFGFTMVYFFEFFAKVSGMGFGEYMNSKWNIMDCIILIIGIVEVILSGTYLREEIAHSSDVEVTRMASSQEGDFLKFIRFIRIIRVLRVFRFIRPIVPVMMKYLNEKVNRKLFLGYDLGKGFVTAVDDVQKFLPQIIEQPRILIKFKSALESQRIEVVKEMGLLQKEHPGIAIAVKTRHASRAVLNHMKDSLQEMKEDGLIDESEFECLMEVLEHKMKHLWNSPSYMKPTTAEVALANVSWMAISNGSKELFEFIYKHATLLTFNAGDIVCQAGDRPNGIHIIIAGLIKVFYEPTFEMSVEREDYGLIPNTELFSDLSFENDMEDYFSTGTVIGELGVLTDQPRAATVTCETATTAYHIPHSVMQEAMKNFQDAYDSLEARLWRTYGIKLASSLLPNEPNFSSWPMERVKTYLERSAVPLNTRYNQLIIPDFISDVVVIYGQVCNASDMTEVFTAPCLVPKHCRHVCNKPGTTISPQMLIIADEEADMWESDGEDDSEDEEDIGTGAFGAGSTSLHRIILTGSRGNSITEEEVLNIQLQRQSRTVSFGVAPQNKRSSVGKEIPLDRKGKGGDKAV